MPPPLRYISECIDASCGAGSESAQSNRLGLKIWIRNCKNVKVPWLPLDCAHWFGNSFSRGWVRSYSFPITTFFQAGADSAHLTTLLDDEWSPALRARLGNWQMWRREIARGILVAAVEDTPAAFLGHAFDQLTGLALQTLNAESLRADELALRVGGAADEFAILSVLLDQLRIALGTFFVEQLIGLESAARSSF